MRNMTDMDSLPDRGGQGLKEQLLQLRLEAARRQRRIAATIVPRDEPRAAAPCSYSQEGLWFLDHLGLIGAAYNVPLALKLSGTLNETALERSFDELVRRHESLRTRFIVIDGVPHQIVDSPEPLALNREDLSFIADPQERDLQLSALIRREQLHRFNLSDERLIRVVLDKLSDDQHTLLLTMHHIISDGWSVGVLVRDLS